MCRAIPEQRLIMSKQLAVASAFSVFAMSALALLAPGAGSVPGSSRDNGAAIEIAAPSFSAELSFTD